MRFLFAGMRAALGTSVLFASCSVVSPPPVAPIHRPPQAREEGTVSISLVGGISAGVWTDGAYGGILRLGYQQRSATEIGLDLLVGHAPKRACREDSIVQVCKDVKARPNWLFGARAWMGHQPLRERDYLATRVGFGYQFTDTGMKVLTGDIALHLGDINSSTDFRGYLAPSYAISVPLDPGPVILERANSVLGELEKVRPQTTHYLTLDGAIGTEKRGNASMLGLLFVKGFGPEDVGAMALTLSGTHHSR